jgi:hypothetical protein
MNPLFFTRKDFLQICDFSFNDIIESFSPLNYKTHIRSFSKFYFSKIEETSYNDDLFGPLNPLLMCIYHNDTKLLQELLNTYRYPRTIKGDLTPLSYAFDKKYISIVELLCENLSQCEYQVEFTCSDFKNLMKSPYGYCHKLMATIPKQTDTEVFPSLIKMTDHVKLFDVNNTNECLLKIQQMESTTRKASCFNNNQNETDKKDVVIYEIPFKYSFSAGSLGSIDFLHNYSESNNEDFLLSQWKNLVIVKWKNQLPLQVIIAVIYWLFMGFVIMSMVFTRQTNEVKNISLVLMGLLFVFELLQVVSYSSYKIKM